MKRRAPVAAALIAAALATLAPAAEPVPTGAAAVQVSRPWAAARIGGGRTAKLFFELEHRGAGADRLVRVRTPVASGPARFVLVTLEDGRRSLRELDAIPIPPESGRLELSEVGYYIELTGLEVPLAPGTRFPVALDFEHAGTVEVEFTSRFHAPDVARRARERDAGDGSWSNDE